MSSKIDPYSGFAKNANLALNTKDKDPYSGSSKNANLALNTGDRDPYSSFTKNNNIALNTKEKVDPYSVFSKNPYLVISGNKNQFLSVDGNESPYLAINGAKNQFLTVYGAEAMPSITVVDLGIKSMEKWRASGLSYAQWVEFCKDTPETTGSTEEPGTCQDECKPIQKTLSQMFDNHMAGHGNAYNGYSGLTHGPRPPGDSGPDIGHDEQAPMPWRHTYLPPGYANPDMSGCASACWQLVQDFKKLKAEQRAERLRPLEEAVAQAQADMDGGDSGGPSGGNFSSALQDAITGDMGQGGVPVNDKYYWRIYEGQWIKCYCDSRINNLEHNLEPTTPGGGGGGGGSGGSAAYNAAQRALSDARTAEAKKKALEDEATDQQIVDCSCFFISCSTASCINCGQTGCRPYQRCCMSILPQGGYCAVYDNASAASTGCQAAGYGCGSPCPAGGGTNMRACAPGKLCSCPDNPPCENPEAAVTRNKDGSGNKYPIGWDAWGGSGNGFRDKYNMIKAGALGGTAQSNGDITGADINTPLDTGYERCYETCFYENGTVKSDTLYFKSEPILN